MYTEKDVQLAMVAHNCTREEAEATYAEQVAASRSAQKAEFSLKELRFQRDQRLSATDWWVLPDRTPTPEQLAYRQALRDITENFTSIEAVVWPEKP